MLRNLEDISYCFNLINRIEKNFDFIKCRGQAVEALPDPSVFFNRNAIYQSRRSKYFLHWCNAKVKALAPKPPELNSELFQLILIVVNNC